MKDSEDRVERGERVRFQATKRAQAETAKIDLQLPQVMRTQTDIVGEIARAFQMAEVNVIQFACKMLLGLQDIERKLAGAAR